MGCVIKVVRTTKSDDSLIGEIFINGIKIGYSLELPWRNNKPRVSCIPAGHYTAFIRKAGTSQWSYDVIQLYSVPGRTAIQIHRGNYPRNTLGCILPGTSKGLNTVWDSKTAMDQIMAAAEDANVITIDIIEQSA